MNKILNRIGTAISTIPNLQTWLDSGKLLLLYALISLPVGLSLGFLKLEMAQASWATIAKIIATCLVMPAMTEELCFRVLLLPHPVEKVTIIERWLWASISLTAFVVYHPLEGLTIYSAGLQTLTNPVFLLLAAILGIICTQAYFQSGSMWSCVMIHWLVVVVWLLLLGGYGKLNS